MWNTFGTEGPLGITTEIVTIDGGGGDQIHAYAARPRGDGTRGGIVAVHHLPGWDEYYFEFSERLARQGFDVICPDLYCRYGHGTPDDVAATVRSQGGVPDESVVGDCQAALNWLKALPTANGTWGSSDPAPEGGTRCWPPPWSRSSRPWWTCGAAESSCLPTS